MYHYFIITAIAFILSTIAEMTLISYMADYRLIGVFTTTRKIAMIVIALMFSLYLFKKIFI